jgi:hypothetical protein
VLTRALDWSLSWARSIKSIPSHPIFLRSILILSPTYVLVFQWSPSFRLSHQYVICIPPLSIRATCHAHLILLDLIILIRLGESTSYEDSPPMPTQISMQDLLGTWTFKEYSFLLILQDKIRNLEANQPGSVVLLSLHTQIRLQHNRPNSVVKSRSHSNIRLTCM